MKKQQFVYGAIFFTVMLFSSLHLLGQTTTYYGEAAGTAGSYNSFFGHKAGTNSTSGANYNTAVGSLALYYNNYADYNVAIGYYALHKLTSGTGTAVGANALRYNTSGYDNTAVGYNSLQLNTTGFRNVSMGTYALAANTTGGYNLAVGYSAMNFNQTGKYNASVGAFALKSNTSGNYNTALGYNSFLSGSNYSNSMALGYAASVSGSNQVRIGNTSVSSIGGYAPWSNLSDARFKKSIRQDIVGLEFINRLQPISFQIDMNALNQFLGLDEEIVENLRIASTEEGRRSSGFIAQDVERIATDLGYDFTAVEKPQNAEDHYSIRYSEFVVPLVKAVQELSLKTDRLEAQISRQTRLIETLISDNALLVDSEYYDGLGWQGRLSQNSPNPVKGVTTIRMEIPDSAKSAYFVVHDTSGREVLRRSIENRGNHNLEVDRADFGPGVYIYSLIIDDKVVDMYKMLLLD